MQQQPCRLARYEQGLTSLAAVIQMAGSVGIAWRALLRTLRAFS